jgi:hypothetical protein
VSSSGRYETQKVLRENPDLVTAVEQLEEPEKPDLAVEGAELLEDIIDFIRKYVLLSQAQAIVLALWTLHTHCMVAADTTPYINVNSAEKESGKTRTLEVEELLVANPWFTGRVTAACLTRKIDAQKPTLLLDESDAAFASGEEYAEALRGVLNTGHRRGGKTSCCVGKGVNIGFKDFETFCPKAIAGLTKLPDTVNSRALPITLERKPRTVKVERFRRKKVKPAADKLRTGIVAWAKSGINRLRTIEPELPGQLSDRQADGAEPLLAIAELIGNGWPEKARDALVELCTSADAEDLSPSVRLLRDIAGIFAEVKVDRISSGTLIEKLVNIDTSPWAERGKARKPLTQNGLARLLRKFKSYDDRPIEPQSINFGEEVTLRGYYREHFVDAWRRYVPGASPELLNTAKTDTPDAEQPEEADLFQPKLKAIESAPVSARSTSQSATATQVLSLSTNKHAVCSSVAVEKGIQKRESVEGEL